MSFKLVVVLPKRIKRVFRSTTDFIRCMEDQRYDRREGLLGAEHAAESTRQFLKHLDAVVRVEEAK